MPPTHEDFARVLDSIRESTGFLAGMTREMETAISEQAHTSQEVPGRENLRV
jgi:hypothetical protein